MKNHKYILFFLLIIPLKILAQNKNHFIGINPNVTIESFYNKGELDINIFPFVYQLTVTKRADLRFTSILNLGIRNNGNDISHFGLETAMPIFLKKKSEKNEFSKGFYASPVISLTRNNIEMHNNIGIWLEPGYNLLFDDKFAMSFGLQIGGTYFNYDNNIDKWRNHFGVKIIFGKWI